MIMCRFFSLLFILAFCGGIHSADQIEPVPFADVTRSTSNNSPKKSKERKGSWASTSEPGRQRKLRQPSFGGDENQPLLRMKNGPTENPSPTKTDKPTRRSKDKAQELKLVLVDANHDLIKVPVSFGQYSKTLKGMIEDLGDQSLIPIHNVNAATFKLIKECVEFLHSDQENADLANRVATVVSFIREQNNDVTVIRDMLFASNYLDIDVIRDALIRILADAASSPNVLHDIATYDHYGRNLVFRVLKTLPKELSQLVAKEISYYGEVVDWITSAIEPSGTLENDADENAAKSTATSSCLVGEHLAMSNSDGQVLMWKLENRQLVNSNKAHKARSTCVCPDSNNEGVYIGSYDGSIKLVALDPEKEVETLGLHDRLGCLAAVVSQKHSLLITAGRTPSIKVWDLKEKKCVQILPGHNANQWVTALCLSEDEELLCSGDLEGAVLIRPIASKEILKKIQSHRHQVNALCFNKNASIIFVAADDTVIKGWDVANGQCVRLLDGHSRPVMSLCLTPDGLNLCSGSVDRSVRVWDLDTGDCKLNLIGHEKSVNALCVSDDGKSLYAGATGKTAKIWDISDQPRGEQELSAIDVVFIKLVKDLITANKKKNKAYNITSQDHLLLLYKELPPYFKRLINRFIKTEKSKTDCQLI
ncbi:MAG TPA: hypothetical protein VEL47_04435 [Myxococcota bacterium]|nr:hypothetical protein [Myxococcota bacterium]